MNCSDPADSPSDPLRKILEVKSTAASVTSVELLLMGRSGREFSPPAPLITNIRAGSFAGAPEKGAGISIFYFFNPSNSLTSKSDMAALQIQASEGTKLTVEQISMKLTNSKDYISFPTSVHVLKEGIRRYVEFCELIFGVNSYIIRQLSSWDYHISQNELTYTDCQDNDEQFSCKVAYAISLRVRLFLHSCIHASHISDVSFPSFSELQLSILYRNFTITLPPSFQQPANPTSKRRNSVNNEASKRAKQGGFSAPVSGERVLNLKPAHPSILMTAGESFHDYYKHLAASDDMKLKHGACLKWHIGGHCSSACPRSSSHGPLTPDLVTSLQKFTEKCRALNK